MPAQARGGPTQTTQRTIPVGTASIVGTVTAADSGRPVRGARVNLSGSAPSAATSLAGLSSSVPVSRSGGPVPGAGDQFMLSGAASGIGMTGLSRSAVTDAQGNFTIARLPAGRFNLTVNHPGNAYLMVNYGQKKPGGRGTPIPLTDGQQARVAIPMIRGGVITGMVIGEDGDPKPNAQVTLWRYFTETGVKRLSQMNGNSTDDRGMYRMFGLQPGDYIVAARPNSNDLMMERMTSDAAAIEAAVASGTVRPPPAPGLAATVVITAPAPAGPGEPQPSYLATYHPSTPVATEAAIIHINGGDERSGIDIQTQPIRASTIQGSVSAAIDNGVAVQITMQPEDTSSVLAQQNNQTRARPDGGFTFNNVSPGRYALLAYTVAAPQVQPGPTGPPRLQDSQKLWGKTVVAVEGQPVVGATLTLQPGRTVAGHVMFEMATPPDLTQPRFTATLNVPPGAQSTGAALSAPIGPDGRFAITGVVPGKYILRAGGGVLKSSIINGQDTLDVPLDFTGERDITDAMVTVTDKVTELSGTLTDATGKPAFDYSILAVSTDPRFWAPGSRRIAIATLNLEGTYTFRSLPPGDYMVAAISDLDPGGQYDHELLRSLAGASLRVTLTEGAKLSQNLRVAK